MTEGSNKSNLITPGAFHDGGNFGDFAGQFDREEAQSKVAKEALISSALESGTISTEFADLLSKIKSSTMGAEGATRMKVECVLAAQNDPDFASIADGRVVYMGSGSDWEFPVALGARYIDMVDLDYKQGYTSLQNDLLERVRSTDENAVLNAEGEIRFQGNFGKGIEEVRLKLHGVEADEYTPEGPVKGVIEYNSPHGSYVEIVRQNLASHVSDGALVLNFDYYKEGLKPDGAFQKDLPRGKFYKVDNAGLFRKWLQEQVRPKGIDIQSIRDKVKMRKEKDEQ